jgi:hypothetical protein
MIPGSARRPSVPQGRKVLNTTEYLSKRLPKSKSNQYVAWSSLYAAARVSSTLSAENKNK